MVFARGPLLLLSGLASFAMSSETARAASIFVQDPAYFHQRQIDLQKLQQDMSSANESLDSLLAEAEKIAKMSDRCAVVSINDVMDESCWVFYQVDLPAFEQHYTQITGEVRLGYMETVRGLQDRKMQIDACANSLVSFISSKEENLNLDGGVSLEPLTKGFEANYDFTLQYEPERRSRTLEIAKVWGETCKDFVIRQDGASFAPFFVEQLDRLNQELQLRGSLAVLKVDSSDSPTIYIDIAKPVRSAYYLNGTKLFHARFSSSNAENSSLRITFTKDGVIAGGEKTVNKPNGTPMHYKGNVQFEENTAKVDGRWFMEGKGSTEGVDFGPDYDEDSLAVAMAEKAQEEQIAAEKKEAEKAQEVEKRKGIQPSFWAGIFGTLASYNDESACKFLPYSKRAQCYSNSKRDYSFTPFDIAAAARIKVSFGPDASAFVTAGVGAMFSIALMDGDYEKAYLAPLAQLEIGYMTFGVRETMIFPIELGEEPAWYQFRTGAFYGFGLFNVELGYTIVKNAGTGFYAGFGITF